MKKFTSARHAQRFLSTFSGISPHFRPGRHRIPAEEYRREMTDRFTTWTEVTGTAADKDLLGTGPTDQTMLVTPDKPTKLMR